MDGWIPLFFVRKVVSDELEMWGTWEVLEFLEVSKAHSLQGRLSLEMCSVAKHIECYCC